MTENTKTRSTAAPKADSTKRAQRSAGRPAEQTLSAKSKRIIDENAVRHYDVLKALADS